jgi:hypothetical protein
VDADRCLDLVLGLLPPDVMQAVLAHTRRCSGCEALFIQTAAIHERGRAGAASALRGYGPIAAETGRVGSGISGCGSPAPNTPAGGASRHPARFWPAAAAIILAAAAAVWILRPGPEGGPIDPPPAIRLSPVDLTHIVADRSDASPDSDHLRGIEAFQRGRLDEAAILLESAPAENGREMMRRIFLAQIHLESGRPAEVVAVLRGVNRHQVPEPWRSEYEWNLMRALHQTGRSESADSLLGVLCRGFGPVGAQARAWRAERSSER